MKTVCAAILAACLGAAGSATVQAQSNTSYGTDALPSTSGSDNSALGYAALQGFAAAPGDISGSGNTAAGFATLLVNTTGSYNTAIGGYVLYFSPTAAYNTAIGYTALSESTGGSNTGIGFSALQENDTGSYNTAIGVDALEEYSDPYTPFRAGPITNNTATGYGALFSNVRGNSNTATGMFALPYDITGYENSATGVGVLYNNNTGHHNTATGDYALYRNVYGNYNIGVGAYSGLKFETGSYNIAIGNQGAANDTGAIRIGTPIQQTSFYLAGVSGVQIGDGIPLYINSDGQLGTVNSSIRFKQDVHDMADASTRLFQLRPVTYRYKQAYPDGSRPVDYGLIAEEVAQVYPDLIARDASGQVLTVQYQKLTPMLLNEVQKHHHQLEAQQKTLELVEQRLSALESSAGSANSNNSKPSLTSE